MDVLKNFAQLKLCRPTKYVYVVGNAGCPLYKFRRKKDMKLVLDALVSAGVTYETTKDKVCTLFYQGYYCGACH